MSDSGQPIANSQGFSGLEGEVASEQPGQEFAFVRENNLGKVVRIIDSAVAAVSEKLDIEKAQTYLFCVFVALLVLTHFCIYLAWNHYSPIIVRFFEKEERLKKASEKEKNKDE